MPGDLPDHIWIISPQRVGRKKHSAGYVEEGNRLLYQHSPRSSLLQYSCLVGVCSQAEKYFRDMDPSGEMPLDNPCPESANSERSSSIALLVACSQSLTPTYLEIPNHLEFLKAGPSAESSLLLFHLSSTKKPFTIIAKQFPDTASRPGLPKLLFH